MPADDPALVSAAGWLLDEEVRVPGDWSVRRPRLAPGGWAFEFENDNYPDIDDTAEVVIALRRVDHPDRARVDAAVRRGVDWTDRHAELGTAAGAPSTPTTPARCSTELPFCDFGEVIDPPCADVTAHVVEMLAHEGLGLGRARPHAASTGCSREQEADGSWFGRWGVNYVYGTGGRAAGAEGDGHRRRTIRASGARSTGCAPTRTPTAAGARTALLRGPGLDRPRGQHRLADRLGADRPARGRVDRDSEAVQRGLAWLAETQRSDGTWDEPQFTGTGFPGDFSINYHLYRLVFPVSALGRWLEEDSP